MNIKKTLLLSSVLFLSLFASCKKDDEEGAEVGPYASFGSSELAIAAHEDELILTITTKEVEWTLSKETDVAWLTLNGDLKGDSTSRILVDVEKNTSLTKRVATLKLEYMLDTLVIRKLEITQMGEVKTIMLGADTLYVTPEGLDEYGEDPTVKVTSNLEWVATAGASWITVGDPVPVTKALTTMNVPFTIEPNTTGLIRVSSVSFTDTKDLITSSIVVFQYPSSSPANDVEALKDLYNSTNGASWTEPWDLAAGVDTWKGVTMGIAIDGTNRVVSLDLSDNNLIGSIPASISKMQYLNELSLYGNNFENSSIPASIGDIYFLRYLYLQNCNLQGEIPVAFGSLQYLERIHLGGNKLSGAIPADFGAAATKIDVFGMANNNLTGNLPEKLGSSSTLKSISVEGNRLSGEIPATYKKNILWLNWTPSQNIYPQQDGFVLK